MSILRKVGIRIANCGDRLSEMRQSGMNSAEFLYILEHRGMNRTPVHAEAGTTMPEVLVAAILLAVFFGSIFELNAVCLRYIDASKESIGALQLVNDRSEIQRNLAFRDLVSR